MKSDKRKSPRKPLRYSAWIALDDEQRVSCLLSDVSDSGARLEVGNNANIPAQFILLLAQRNAPKRYCTVVWRENNQIGVRFERRNEKVAPADTDDPRDRSGEPVARAGQAGSGRHRRRSRRRRRLI